MSLSVCYLLSDVHYRYSTNEVFKRVVLLLRHSIGTIGIEGKLENYTKRDLRHEDFLLDFTALSRNYMINVNKLLHTPVYVELKECKINGTLVKLPSLNLSYKQNYKAESFLYAYDVKNDNVMCDFLEKS